MFWDNLLGISIGGGGWGPDNPFATGNPLLGTICLELGTPLQSENHFFWTFFLELVWKGGGALITPLQRETLFWGQLLGIRNPFAPGNPFLGQFTWNQYQGGGTLITPLQLETLLGGQFIEIRNPFAPGNPFLGQFIWNYYRGG